MVDSLENRIGIALKATQYQMHHSDAKEGLTYMHERVEELREFGNPWDNIDQFYRTHFELTSFLFHLGFSEFDTTLLKTLYSNVYWGYHKQKETEEEIKGKIAHIGDKFFKFREKRSALKRKTGWLHDFIFEPNYDARKKLKETKNGYFQLCQEVEQLYDTFEQAKIKRMSSYNHPWITNTHPTFNTSAYSAKLVGLSAQLEALQSGNFQSPTRLLTG